MNSIHARLTAGALIAVLAANASAATPDSEPDDAGAPVTDAAPIDPEASSHRWSAQVETRTRGTALLVTDELTGTRYRLSDFENTGVVNAHWVAPDQLEVDFPTHERTLEVRWSEKRAAPTFHLVVSQFDVDGAARVDYYSPPLVARLDTPRVKANPLDH